MRKRAVLLLAAVLLAMLLPGCGRQEKSESKPPLLILDTDLASDADDVGAVAVLHHLADQGRVRILAMMVSSANPWSAACLQSLNAWFGRPEIPVGKAAAGAVEDESAYTHAIAEEFPCPAAEPQEAVTLYRRLLAEQADQSVLLVTTGYLTNLDRLLRSKPDALSPLTGLELVRRKVRHLVCMGGQYPSGQEWNFHQDAAAAAYVVSHWPRPIFFVGFELGKDILTGAGLRRLPAKNPIRRSYELHNKLAGRPSWDQIAVYYAVMASNDGQSAFWSTISGRNLVQADGSNRWLAETEQNAAHAYLVQRAESGQIASQLEQLMLTAAP
ncbi:Inosine-uridine nucleoside N-ribohydrolase [Candidatus Electronema halotolerans]